MQNRRDQLQAHVYLTGRMVSALVRAEPDAPDTPMRRFTVWAFVGVLVAALVMAGFAVFGVLRPGGSKTWQQPGTVILEKETGNRYLYLDGKLRPVLNYVSAQLMVGSQPALQRVPGKSLRDVSHGPPVGIPGAPDALPDPKRLTADPWLVCSPTAPDTTGADRPIVAVAVGGTQVSPLPDDRGVLVQTPDKVVYLAWRDRRLRITDQATLLALGYANVQPFQVDARWVNALTAGKELQSPSVDRLGEAGPLIGGRPTRIGQVIVVRSTGNDGDYYLVDGRGLLPITQTEAALVLADDASAAAYPDGQVVAVQISVTAAADAPKIPRDQLAGDFPVTPPNLVEALPGSARAPCARWTVGSTDTPKVDVAFVDTPQVVGSEVGPGRASDTRAADRVVVPPGGGLLVRDQPAAGVSTGTLYLVTDLGMKFPLPSDEVASTLGYSGVKPILVPTTVLAFLPTGPALDPEAVQVLAPGEAASIPVPGQPPGAVPG